MSPRTNVRTLAALACISLAFFPTVTALSAAVLVLLLLPASKAWGPMPS